MTNSNKVSTTAAASTAKDAGSYSRLIPHYAFYGEYHSNEVNKWIHITCVPIILCTFFAIFHRYVPLESYVTNPAVSKFLHTITGASISLSTVALFVYVLFYVWMAPNMLGVSAATLVFLLFQGAQLLLDYAGPNAMKIAIGANVVAWILQFYGHGVHERRSPALLDNLMQAFLMAPLFVYIEALTMMGFLKDLHRIVQPIVDERIRVHRASKKSN